jgi:RNA polymerase sigma-70 factor (ECF subfamily)
MSDSVLPSEGRERTGGDVADVRLTRMLSGEVAALAEFFADERPRLQRMVEFRLDPRLRGRVDADDILQEAYVAAAQRLEALRTSQPMSPLVWLRLIVGQTLIDVHRRHIGAQRRGADRERSIQANLAGGTSMTMTFHLLGRLTSPSNAALKAELSGLVTKALDEMNETDREVLALRHFEELTNKETAEVLGIEPKAASIRYVRALARLKEVLKHVPGFFDADGR